MQRKPDSLVPIGDALADLPGPVKALREATPQALHHFTLSDQVHQLVSASEADRDLGFMARMMALCNRHQYKRVNGPYKLVMVAGADNKLPYGNLPRLLMAWLSTEAVRTQSHELVLGRSLSEFMRTRGSHPMTLHPSSAPSARKIAVSTPVVARKRRSFLMQKTLALLLAATLLAVPAASAKTVSVEVPWEKARTIIAEGDYRPKIRVELHSSERLKGKLVGTTDAGLRLVRLRYETKIAKSGTPSGRRQSARRFERQDTETLIAREDIRTIRLRPRKTTRYKYRLLGLLGGIPPGFLGAM